jgi:DNA topoisomerase-2
MISWKVKFILAIVEGKMEIRNKKKSVIHDMLENEKYPKLGKIGVVEGEPGFSSSYDYLLTMDLYKLSYEEVEELKKKRDAKQTEHDILMNKKPTDLWIEDLDEFEKNYKIILDEYDKTQVASKPKKKKTTSK